MATYTPNLSLYMPDSTDDFGEFREEHNDNMVKIDNAIGGGGGSGGHTIVDPTGADMPQENKLQFTGAVSVSDDSANGQTVVNVEGGGGNVYGAFIDPTRVVYSSFVFDSSAHTWTATEDCILTDNMLPPDSTTAYFIRIGGKQVFAGYSTVEDPFVYVKKGQVVEYRAKSGSSLKAYGVTQGTSGIFTPIIYSDTERVVGVWRDNKPLYKKTWFFNSTIIINANTWTSLGISAGDIENVVMNETIDDEGRSNAVNYCGVRNSYISAYSDLATNIQVLTLYYTKTTDVAGSGNWNTDGVPTVHYSTSEQVIGTWENGKPLYRRIFTTNTMNISTSAGALYSGSVAIGDYIPDVDQIFVDIGKTYVNVSGVTRGLISASQEGSVIAVYSIVSRSNCTITFTVDYTKVTD